MGWMEESTSGNPIKIRIKLRHYLADIERRCNGSTDKVHRKKGANEGFTYGLEYYKNTYNIVFSD